MSHTRTSSLLVISSGHLGNRFSPDSPAAGMGLIVGRPAALADAPPSQPSWYSPSQSWAGDIGDLGPSSSHVVVPTAAASGHFDDRRSASPLPPAAASVRNPEEPKAMPRRRRKRKYPQPAPSPGPNAPTSRALCEDTNKVTPPPGSSALKVRIV